MLVSRSALLTLSRYLAVVLQCDMLPAACSGLSTMPAVCHLIYAVMSSVMTCLSLSLAAMPSITA